MTSEESEYHYQSDHHHRPTPEAFDLAEWTGDARELIGQAPGTSPGRTRRRPVKALPLSVSTSSGTP